MESFLTTTPSLYSIYLCPKTQRPFEDAQMVNCEGHHSFSHTVVASLFGDIQKERCTQPGPCPLCGSRVTAYFPNPALQAIVDTALGQKNEKDLLSSGPVTLKDVRQQSVKHIQIKRESNIEITHPLDASFVKKELDPEKYCEHIKILNPDHTAGTLFVSREWDTKYYNQHNLPISLGELKEGLTFSGRPSGKPTRFLDLPIYMPGQGWRIPACLEQFKEVIEKAMEYERTINPSFEKNHYVYITVDQGDVQPATRQRRGGWHGDSYRHIDTTKHPVTIPADHLYVIADSCPTLWIPGPFSFDGVDPENVDEVLAHFATVANSHTPITYPNYTLLMMDPYCVHDAGCNLTSEVVPRTFVKISVSPVKYCKLGNEHNSLFDYDWAKIPRHGVPYTKEVLAESAHRKDRDAFKLIDPKQIDFTQNEAHVDWAERKIFTCCRVNPVKAVLATEGEMLISSSEDFKMTINVANPGDWKVTAKCGDQYFLSDLKMRSLYSQTPVGDEFFPKGEMRRAVKLTDDIRYMAPWGTLCYARKDDYLVFLNRDDVYSIPRALFEEDHRKLL